MEKMKSLADQIREELGKPVARATEVPPKARAPAVRKLKNEATPRLPDIIQAIATYDNALHKNMVHVRFDKKTVDTLTKFKMATGTDITKFVAFAVQHVLDTHPEIKSTIKHYIQNTDL
ncbi:hypothetical protein [Mucilaginibacter sp. PAMB04168]|uniref:hypothetical protein n=1 Tax=Mucilaginibacter sp. PAMB04168 TaxID=3138567 RepID=UPI0031F63A50